MNGLTDSVDRREDGVDQPGHLMDKMMDREDQTAVLVCLREIWKPLGLGKADEVAAQMFPRKSENFDHAKDALYGRTIGRQRSPAIADAALTLFAREGMFERIRAHYHQLGKNTYKRIAEILDDYRGIKVDSEIIAPPAQQIINPAGVIEPEVLRDEAQPATGYIDIIFQNWKDSGRKGNRLLETGIYQSFRRYKPGLAPSGIQLDKRDINVLSDVVVCELIFVDSDKMECLMITWEGNIYHGAMFINHENILYGILQRRTRDGGLNQRVIVMHLESKKGLRLYSGHCIKTGSSTYLSVSSECFYIRVPEDFHKELHEEVNEIRARPWLGKRVERVGRESVVSRYITEQPPIAPYDANSPEWSRVKFLQDFEDLAKLAIKDADGAALFPEPSRTLPLAKLLSIARWLDLPVFHWPHPTES